MKKVAMMGVLALAATTAMAQSTTTGSGQSGSSTSGQSTGSDQGSSSDKDKDKKGGHGMTPSDSSSSSSTSPSGSSTGSLSPSDRRFIETAARGGMAEVELGRLGTEKATSPEVKTFAQMLVDDHTKANDELKTLASQKGVTLPTDTDSAHKAMRDKLEKMSGEQFDKAFMQQMLKDHKKDVAEFQKQAKSTRGDDDVKSWASKTLPTLEQHLQHAQQASNMNAAGGTSATSTDSSKSKKKGSSGSTDDRP